MTWEGPRQPTRVASGGASIGGVLPKGGTCTGHGVLALDGPGAAIEGDLVRPLYVILVREGGAWHDDFCPAGDMYPGTKGLNVEAALSTEGRVPVGVVAVLGNPRTGYPLWIGYQPSAVRRGAGEA